MGGLMKIISIPLNPQHPKLMILNKFKEKHSTFMNKTWAVGSLGKLKEILKTLFLVWYLTSLIILLKQF